MSSTLLNSMPPVYHIKLTELEIPLTAVKEQSNFKESPIVKFLKAP